MVAGELRHAHLRHDLLRAGRRLEDAREEVRAPRPCATPSAPTTSISASSASSTAGRSEAGSPCASEPPIVPRCRTCGSPISPADVRDERAVLLQERRRRDVVVARQRADRDRGRPCRGRTRAPRAGRRRRAATAAIARSRSSGSSEWPPASSFASSRSPSSETACSDRLGDLVVERGRDHAPHLLRARATPARAWRAWRCRSTPSARERVDDGVDDGRRRGDRAGLPHALDPERVRRARRLGAVRAPSAAARPPTGRGRWPSRRSAGCRPRRRPPPRRAPARRPGRGRRGPGRRRSSG